MDPITLQNKGITFDFSKWTLDTYQRVISNAQIWIGFKNAVVIQYFYNCICTDHTVCSLSYVQEPILREEDFSMLSL